MIPKKTLAALETVIKALAPLDPESRRRVIEATHTLVQIGAGRPAANNKAPAKGRKRST